VADWNWPERDKHRHPFYDEPPPVWTPPTPEEVEALVAADVIVIQARSLNRVFDLPD
jgi:hypothetical protein